MEIDFKDPKYYTNRELSWVLFDYRVLNEARDKSIPCLLYTSPSPRD
mgnify:CR=1 FL=1